MSEAGSKAALFKNLETDPVSLITLDLNLGSEDGLVVARDVRAVRNVPIIMISGRVGPEDRVTGLEFGADDYIVKPFHIKEVILRVRNVLARYHVLAAAAISQSGLDGMRFTFDAGVLDTGRRELTATDGGVIDLTDVEHELLAIFLQHPKRVLSRDQIMQLLKGRDWSPLDRMLDGHVARLRKKIEPPGEAPWLIKSVRGVGYIYTGDVTS